MTGIRSGLCVLGCVAVLALAPPAGAGQPAKKADGIWLDPGAPAPQAGGKRFRTLVAPLLLDLGGASVRIAGGPAPEPRKIERITITGGKVEITGDTIRVEGGKVEVIRTGPRP